MKTQKELKEMYKAILENEVWRNSKDMVDYCVKKVNHIVELENGDIVVIEKPAIKKDFCFGYSDSRYDTDDYDRANAMAAHAATSKEYFIAKNLEGINETIEQFENPGALEHFIGTQYTGQAADSKLKCVHTFYWHDERKNKYTPLTYTDRKAIIDGYKVVKAAFEKRLNTYLKKYGLTQVNSWSYWQDE